MILDTPILAGGASAFRLTAGENLVVGDVIALDTLGQAIKAVSTGSFSTSLWRVFGIAREAVSTGQLVSVVSAGNRAEVLFGTAPSSLSNGSHVFLSATAGEATVTPPSGSGRVIYIVGILQGADGVTLTPDVILLPQYVSRRP